MTTGFSQFLVLSFVALTLSACGDDDSAPDDDAAVETGVETGVEVGADTSDAGEDAAALRVLSSGSESAFVADDEWYRHAVFYELWVRSFQDSDGDGIGDFPGLTSRLDYLQELGVEALWLMPFFPSPLIDSGYDVADYIGVNPDYGTLEDVDAFLAAAEERGIRVYLDLVFNHVSDQHPWFLDSRENPDGERGDWFVWEDEEGENCSAPLGVFGDERWAFDETRGQYYFHQFFPRQPDLNFESEEVQQALLDSARFWLERGVDGFRLDVPYHYAEEPPECEHLPGSFAFLRRLRALTDEFDASMVGEVLASGDIFDQYLEPDILQMSYSLANIVGTNVLASTGIPGAQFIGLEDFESRKAPGKGALATILGNHDVPRISGSSGTDERVRLMAIMHLTTPGVPFVYYGEELGMLNGPGVIVDMRDQARTPMQWDGTENAGFTTGTPFLELAPEADVRNVMAEDADADSILNLYRRLIALRTENRALTTGTLEVLEGFSSLAFWRRHPEDGALLMLINYNPNEAPAALPASSLPSGELPTDRLTNATIGEFVEQDGEMFWSVTVPADTAYILEF